MRGLRRRTPSNRPLRVHFVVPDLRHGGAERHAATLLPALDRTRFVPSVTCIGDGGDLFEGVAAAGVAARSLGLRKRQGLRALIRLVREMNRERPDLVVTRGYNAEALGRLAAAVARVPRAAIWVHNASDIEPRGRVRRLVDRVLDPLTDAYFGVAEAQVPYLVESLGYPRRKIRVVHNGIDHRRFAPSGDDAALRHELGITTGSPVVGIVAVLRAEKDHGTLLRAFRRVAGDHPDATLLVVGDGPLRADLEKLSADLGLTDRVVFTGSRSDVRDLFGVMDVAVLCSTTECFPLSVLEAMASARPTVCTDVGGIPEMVVPGETGHLVPVGDDEALATRLLELLTDPARAAAMGAAGRERVLERFTLEQSVAASEKAMAETVGTAPGTVDRPVRLTVVMDLVGVGGVEVLLLNLFRRFDPAAVTPRLVCLREPGPLAAEFTTLGFDVEVLGGSGPARAATRLRRLVASLRRTDTDVVLVSHHHRAALSLGRIAARVAGVPNLVAAHDMDLTRVGGRVLPRRDVESLFLSDGLVLLATSQGHYLRAEEGVGRYPWRRTRREDVIPNGIPLAPAPTAHERRRARELLGLEDGDFAIGVVARLRPQKKHEMLFAAFAAMAADVPRARLMVIGDGEREQALRTLADRLGLADRIRFLGTRRDVGDLLPGLDVSCLSSVHEGAPLSILESMAAGLPVVVTRCGALPDMVEDGASGYVVPVDDSAAFADRLRTLASDPVLRRRLGDRGRVIAERDHDIDHTTALFQHLLASIRKS